MEDIVNRPLSLEDAVAIAPAHPPSPTFTASTSAIAWGAVRSGKSIWEYIIGMTQEFEAKLQAAYEAWKAENAWYHTSPCSMPDTSSDTAYGEKESAENVRMEGPDAPVTPATNAPVPPAMDTSVTPPTDAPYASLPDTSFTPATDTSFTPATDTSFTPVMDTSFAPPTDADGGAAPVSAATDTNGSAPPDKSQSTEKPDAEDLSLTVAKAAPRKTTKKDAKLASQDEMLQGIANLPKDPDPALYASILSLSDRETLKAALKLFIEKKKRIHRPRAAQTAFLNWLENNNVHPKEAQL